MGFFDFLHGNRIRSESEVYMEQRNKEYAKKAAAYRRKEYAYDVADKLRDYLSFGQPTTTTQRTYSQPTQRTTSSCYQSNDKIEDCSVCDTPKEKYYASCLNVVAASMNSSTRSVTVSGSVARGRFMTGDTVIIKYNNSEYRAVIGAIIRQGERIQYANTSSGKLAIIFNNFSAQIGAGAIILKEQLG